MQGKMVVPTKHIALYGGTFCPIQNAHLRLANALQAIFNFDQFRFLPNKEPVLDKIVATSLPHRMAMLELALKPYPKFMIDTREINRSTPSFMVDTLDDLRNELSEEPCNISVIIGMDNFLQFHRWHARERILTLCNLIIIERPGVEMTTLPALMTPQPHEIVVPEALSSGETGGFYRCNAGLYDISSTRIRDLIEAGVDVGLFLPAPVWDYIKKHKLFGYHR